MLERPRSWLAESIREHVLKDMRMAIGPTASINAGRLALLDLHQYVRAKLATMVIRDLQKMGKPAAGGTKLMKRLSLVALVKKLRNLTAAVVLSKLSSSGLEVSHHPVPHPNPDPKPKLALTTSPHHQPSSQTSPQPCQSSLPTRALIRTAHTCPHVVRMRAPASCSPARDSPWDPTSHPHGTPPRLVLSSSRAPL
jgi:hypothetical protein